MQYVGLFFPIVLILPFVIFGMCVYSAIKHIRLYIKNGDSRDLDEVKENLLFILVTGFIVFLIFCI